MVFSGEKNLTNAEHFGTTQMVVKRSEPHAKTCGAELYQFLIQFLVTSSVAGVHRNLYRGYVGGDDHKVAPCRYQATSLAILRVHFDKKHPNKWRINDERKWMLQLCHFIQVECQVGTKCSFFVELTWEAGSLYQYQAK